ncbi:hypothetical protein SAMN05444280_10881 [Tangfeifania diversioriginum]|uniref:Uncharacterized protein n=1 Tax=Tangfeifania diversioriginum TaxID=1168035 RepID=A0A1M6F9L6_9BACT|nr:hypothetical protein SAMN05444280_10881 [Tangfeifania diversioriginum]
MAIYQLNLESAGESTQIEQVDFKPPAQWNLHKFQTFVFNNKYCTFKTSTKKKQILWKLLVELLHL